MLFKLQGKLISWGDRGGLSLIVPFLHSAPLLRCQNAKSEDSWRNQDTLVLQAVLSLRAYDKDTDYFHAGLFDHAFLRAPAYVKIDHVVESGARLCA